MHSFDRLVEIMSKLRDPVGGCPWDLKQTPESLIPNFIEELHEAVEAIEENDDTSLTEELGDLLLHIVFQAQMANEQNRFGIDDVLQAINSKLERRHPHIFGDLEMTDAYAVKINWERLKKAEKTERISVLEGIPRAMPGLIYAQRTQEKAASVGFDWPDHRPVMAKLHEEIAELNEALESGDRECIKDEVGDLLFTLVNLARKLHLDAETCVKATTRKFTSRFQYIEGHYRTTGKDIHDASLEELDSLWEKAKDL